jgi:hypothetical protein
VPIDYTYLWDIVCQPNPALFPKGVNMAIMEITNNDITNNVEIICPTNMYSGEKFDLEKSTIIIIHQNVKEGALFEPIYLYKNAENKIQITKMFSVKDGNVPENMRRQLKEVFAPVLNKSCAPLSSKPREYRFKRPIRLTELVEILNELNMPVVKQMVNDQGKVISIVSEEPRKSFVIPCQPSSLLSNIDYVFLTDESYYQTYQETVAFLTQLHQKSRKRIPCSPVFKIVEDEMIVGLLTQSTQFVMISDPTPSSLVYDSIPEIKSSNYIQADLKTIHKENLFDKERVEYIEKIKGESKLYQVFRNTIRILINKYEN